MELTTDYKRKKEARNKRIYDRYRELMSKEGSQKGMATLQVMKEFGIYSAATIWKIRKCYGD